MKTFLSVGLATLVVTAFSTEAANAWTREGSVTTERGTYSYSGSGGCSGRTCSRVGTVTGPDGYSVSRSGSVTRVTPHYYTYSRTTTGPYGGTVHRRGGAWW